MINIEKCNKLNKKELKLFKKMIVKLNSQPFKKVLKKKIEYKEFRAQDIGNRVLYALKHNFKTIGFMEVVLYQEFVLLDYFYIKKSFRKLGLGSSFLGLLKKKYKNIVLCIFKYTKRYEPLKEFYIKNGFSVIQKPIQINSYLPYLEEYLLYGY